MWWEFDPGHSQIGFAIWHMGLSLVHGVFRTADVKIAFDPDDMTQASISAVIDAASITTFIDNRDARLRSDEYLDVERYPTIAFTSTSVERKGDNRYAIHGDFTLHGVTRPIVLDAVYNGELPDQRDRIRRGVSARATLSRKDYGMESHPTAAGVVITADRVDVLLEIEVIRHDD